MSLAGTLRKSPSTYIAHLLQSRLEVDVVLGPTGRPRLDAPTARRPRTYAAARVPGPGVAASAFDAVDLALRGRRVPIDDGAERHAAVVVDRLRRETAAGTVEASSWCAGADGGAAVLPRISNGVPLRSKSISIGWLRLRRHTYSYSFEKFVAKGLKHRNIDEIGPTDAIKIIVHVKPVFDRLMSTRCSPSQY